MEENHENIAQLENSTKKIEKTLFEFVESLFDGQGKKLSNGDISIEMEGTPRFLVVHLYDNKDKKTVEVSINRVLMGEFIEYEEQGYQYKFIQRYRLGIGNGRTSAEQYIEDTCAFHKDKILLQRAYH